MYKSNKLSVRYKEKLIIYPDFEIGYGDFVLVKGSSGTGKSSLLNILGLIKKDYEGSIKFFDREIKDLNDKETSKYLSKNICYILQEGDLIEELSVKENIELGSLVKLSKDELDRELADFGLRGYGDKKVCELSGGEKRRVSLVKAVLSGKDILILDEPFYSIDKSYSDKLIEKLYEIKNEKLIVISMNNDFIDKINLNDSVIIDLNDSKTIFKNSTAKSNYNIKQKENLFLEKEIPKIKINFLIQFFIFLFLFFSLFWLKSFENKTKRYFNEDKIYYIYTNNQSINISKFVNLKNDDFLALNKGKENINDILIEKFYFDKYSLGKVSDLIGNKINKDFCYLSKSIYGLCDKIKIKEKCSKCIFIDKQFLSESIYLLKFSEKINYNFLVYKNSSFKPDLNLSNFEKGEMNCVVNEVFASLYPKLKRLRIFFQFFLFGITFFIAYNLVSKKQKYIRTLIRNGFEKKCIFKFFIQKIISYFSLSFLSACLLFYFFSIYFSGFIKISFYNDVFLYGWFYFLCSLILSIFGIYIRLKFIR
jgi:putative ABC transport system ATP-binding protein